MVDDFLVSGVGNPGDVGELPTDYLRIALECAHDGIVIADSDAVMIYANRGYELISGFNRNDIIGKSLYELIDQGYISISGTLNVLETGEPFSTTQVFKTQRRAIIASTPVCDEQGRITMVVTNLRDMTEVHQMKGELRRRELQSQHYYEKLQSLKREIRGDFDYVAVDTATLRLLSFGERLAEVNDPILLTGESGTGKRKLAQFIHRRSERSLMPFTRINVAGANLDTQMAYLFGTARERETQPVCGVLGAADGGTVYFDEIAVLLPEVQLKLNEILESGEYTVDGVRYKANVRIIAGTRYTLDELKSYIPEYSSLYHELSLFPIIVPPLRERTDDIVPLLDYFLTQYNHRTGKNKTFSPEAYRELLSYSWPGNVTELMNMVKMITVTSDEDVIGPEAITALYSSVSALPDTEKSVEPAEKVDLKSELELMEARYMTQAFERFRNTRQAAESLSMTPSTFIRKRQQYEKEGLMKRGKAPADD